MDVYWCVKEWYEHVLMCQMVLRTCINMQNGGIKLHQPLQHSYGCVWCITWLSLCEFTCKTLISTCIDVSNSNIHVYCHVKNSDEGGTTHTIGGPRQSRMDQWESWALLLPLQLIVASWANPHRITHATGPIKSWYISGGPAHHLTIHASAPTQSDKSSEPTKCKSNQYYGWPTQSPWELVLTGQPNLIVINSSGPTQSKGNQ